MIANASRYLQLDADQESSAGMIIAGYDRRHGGQVYSIPLGGSLHKQSYAIGGSGSTYIYGYCDSYWREGMTEEEGVEFVDIFISSRQTQLYFLGAIRLRQSAVYFKVVLGETFSRGTDDIVGGYVVAKISVKPA